jgi:hypothetical protein
VFIHNGQLGEADTACQPIPQIHGRDRVGRSEFIREAVLADTLAHRFANKLAPTKSVKQRWFSV